MKREPIKLQKEKYKEWKSQKQKLLNYYKSNAI